MFFVCVCEQISLSEWSLHWSVLQPPQQSESKSHSKFVVSDNQNKSDVNVAAVFISVHLLHTVPLRVINHTMDWQHARTHTHTLHSVFINNNNTY